MKYLTIIFLFISNHCWCQDKTRFKFTGVFAIEICDSISPLCTDGLGETYRIYPYLVRFCNDNVLKCYDTVFSLDQYYNHKIASAELDELFEMIKHGGNFHHVFSRKLKKKTNRYFKQNKTKTRFDGYLKYKIFKIDFFAKYLDYVPIIIPTSNNRKGLISIIDIPMFEIIEILSINLNE
jgi:hypothetical protein